MTVRFQREEAVELAIRFVRNWKALSDAALWEGVSVQQVLREVTDSLIEGGTYGLAQAWFDGDEEWVLRTIAYA